MLSTPICSCLIYYHIALVSPIPDVYTTPNISLHRACAPYIPPENKIIASQPPPHDKQCHHTYVCDIFHIYLSASSDRLQRKVFAMSNVWHQIKGACELGQSYRKNRVLVDVASQKRPPKPAWKKSREIFCYELKGSRTPRRLHTEAATPPPPRVDGDANPWMTCHASMNERTQAS